MLVRIGEDRQAREEIERQAKAALLQRAYDLCLRHAQRWDEQITLRMHEVNPSEYIEWRGRALEAADLAETFRVLLSVYQPETT